VGTTKAVVAKDEVSKGPLGEEEKSVGKKESHPKNDPQTESREKPLGRTKKKKSLSDVITGEGSDRQHAEKKVLGQGKGQLQRR